MQAVGQPAADGPAMTARNAIATHSGDRGALCGVGKDLIIHTVDAAQAATWSWWRPLPENKPSQGAFLARHLVEGVQPLGRCSPSDVGVNLRR